jgi:hypothetical protein
MITTEKMTSQNPTLSEGQIRLQKTCRQCNKSFNIYDIDLEYLDKLSPIIAGQKFALPTPTMCPECRKIQRLAWRNESKIFKRKDDFSGKEIIALYSPNSKNTIYDYNTWISDVWNPLDY